MNECNYLGKIYIQMFTHFKIEGMGGALDEDNIHSEMLNKLLTYMACHHKKEIATQDLVEVLWYDEESDNPAGALKNLVYRLRTMLKKQWPDTEFILTGRGSYRWNPEINVETDSEGFEKYCEAAQRETELDKKIENYMRAIELYRGMFLPKLISEYWVASLSTYYHSLYLTAVKAVAALLEEDERYEEMCQVCKDALTIDNLDESLHCYFIRSLVRQKKLKLALEQYKNAVDILYEKLGITPSKELREVYNELLKQTHESEKSISAIQKELNDDTDPGAFYCEYGVFKKTYHLEKRRAERLGISVYLSLITVVPNLNIKEENEAYLSIINEGMDRLKRVLLKSLRAGDVISKYSGSQFIVLLPTCQYESAKMVMRRIEDAFIAEDSKKPKVKLQYNLDEMDYESRM